MPARFAAAPHPERILVATDFSDASRRAVEHGLRLAQDGGGEVTLVHVVPGIDIAAAGRGSGPSMAQAEAQLVAEARTRLAGLASEVEAAGVAVRTRVEEGVPADRIVATAATLRADVIVVATHGMGGFRRLVLGSVADAVLKHAEVPVLLVR